MITTILANGDVKKDNSAFWSNGRPDYTLGRQKGNKIVYKKVYNHGAKSHGGCLIVNNEAKADYFIAIKGEGCYMIKALGKKGNSCINDIESCFWAINKTPINTYWTAKEGFEKWSKRWNKRI